MPRLRPVDSRGTPISYWSPARTCIATRGWRGFEWASRFLHYLAPRTTSANLSPSMSLCRRGDEDRRDGRLKIALLSRRRGLLGRRSLYAMPSPRLATLRPPAPDENLPRRIRSGAGLPQKNHGSMLEKENPLSGPSLCLLFCDAFQRDARRRQGRDPDGGRRSRGRSPGSDQMVPAPGTRFSVPLGDDTASTGRSTPRDGILHKKARGGAGQHLPGQGSDNTRVPIIIRRCQDRGAALQNSPHPRAGQARRPLQRGNRTNRAVDQPCAAWGLYNQGRGEENFKKKRSSNVRFTEFPARRDRVFRGRTPARPPGGANRWESSTTMKVHRTQWVQAIWDEGRAVAAGRELEQTDRGRHRQLRFSSRGHLFVPQSPLASLDQRRQLRGAPIQHRQKGQLPERPILRRAWAFFRLAPGERRSVEIYENLVTNSHHRLACAGLRGGRRGHLGNVWKGGSQMGVGWSLSRIRPRAHPPRGLVPGPRIRIGIGDPLHLNNISTWRQAYIRTLPDVESPRHRILT